MFSSRAHGYRTCILLANKCHIMVMIIFTIEYMFIFLMYIY